MGRHRGPEPMPLEGKIGLTAGTFTIATSILATLCDNWDLKVVVPPLAALAGLGVAIVMLCICWTIWRE